MRAHANKSISVLLRMDDDAIAELSILIAKEFIFDKLKGA